MNTEVLQSPQLSTGKLLLLGLSSVVLCISFIMSVFAPFPLALACLLYGRGKGILTGLLGLVLSFGFTILVYRDLTLFVFYVGVLICGLGIAEIAIRGISPVKGLVGFGLIILTMSFGAFYGVLKSEKLTVEQFVLKQLEKSADKLAEQKKIIEQSNHENRLEVLQLLDKPELIAREMIESVPGYMFIGVFLMLWFNMFLVLKSRRLLMPALDFPFSEKNLLNFRVPFGFVLVLASGFVLFVWGKDLGILGAEAIGLTVIKCMGIFYFFQGFGVLSDLLNFLGLMGFFRSLMVMVIIFTASYLIAAVGLFDNWFDFRKYFNKNKIEN